MEQKQHSLGTQWLESNAMINANELLTFNFDVSGMTDVIRRLISTVLSSSKSTEKAMAETVKCQRLLGEMKHSVFQAEEKCRQLEEEVEKAKQEINVIAERKVNISDFKGLQELFASQTEEIKNEQARLEASKLDCDGPQLESDCRKYSLDTIKSFYTARNKETRSWVERKIDTLQQGIQQSTDERFAGIDSDIRQTSVLASERLDFAKMELEKHLRLHDNTIFDFSVKISSLVRKVHSVESDIDSQVSNCRILTLHSLTEIRLLSACFGTTYETLRHQMGSSCEGISIADVKLGKSFLESDIQRLHNRLSSWEKVYEHPKHCSTLLTEAPDFVAWNSVQQQLHEIIESKDRQDTEDYWSFQRSEAEESERQKLSATNDEIVLHFLQGIYFLFYFFPSFFFFFFWKIKNSPSKKKKNKQANCSLNSEQ